MDALISICWKLDDVDVVSEADMASDVADAPDAFLGLEDAYWLYDIAAAVEIEPPLQVDDDGQVQQLIRFSKYDSNLRGDRKW